MTMTSSRRRLLTLGTSIASLAALAGCTITTGTGAGTGTTTITIDTAKIVTDGQAIITALSAMIAAPSIVVLLGANAAVAEAAFAAASAALTQLQQLTNGTVTASINVTSVQNAVKTLVADAQQVLSLVQGVVSKLTGSVATTVGNYVAAAQTLLPFVTLAASLTPTVSGMGSGAVVPMSEGAALAIAMSARPL